MKRPQFSLRTLLLLTLLVGAAGGLVLPRAVTAIRAWLYPPPPDGPEYHWYFLDTADKPPGQPPKKPSDAD